MFREAREAPDVVARQLASNAARAKAIGARLRKMQSRAVVTGARGSSDNAATFAKYLIETKTGIITSSTGLSIASVYAAQPKFDNVLFLAISQSGKSPDLLAAAESAKSGGAYVVALVNDDASPLAALADDVLPLMAQAETSIAATKTYLASVCAVAHLVSEWSEDSELIAALHELPALMRAAWNCDWYAAVERLAPVSNLYTIGRGMGFGAAQELALKFKETCGLHAEAFSSAEVRHGPMALVRKGFSALLLSQRDETRAGLEELAAKLAATGSDVMVAGFSLDGTISLPTVPAHPALEPILMVQSFYRMVDALAQARGFDPDCPPNLNKITETR
ncbi:MAG: SIS domain-containing protein [Alphaproteobacteria bacterium]|nr:SIS domain-containing protein [Alphaproteobacteria bacterium]MBL6938492.1 SIS domain-containing protein [Alphaproteobacteria bacterium]MBL7096551.1 SIS domain-containing protein [Alphaproteobacteria bacterium]